MYLLIELKRLIQDDVETTGNLTIKDECKLCGAPMVTFVLKAGGRVSICSRKGCSNHYLTFQDLTQELSKFYNEFGL